MGSRSGGSSTRVANRAAIPWWQSENAVSGACKSIRVASDEDSVPIAALHLVNDDVPSLEQPTVLRKRHTPYRRRSRPRVEWLSTGRPPRLPDCCANPTCLQPLLLR